MTHECRNECWNAVRPKAAFTVLANSTSLTFAKSDLCWANVTGAVQ